MPIYRKTDFHGGFIVMNQAAVDIANITAVTSLDTDIDVETADGEDQFPLRTTDFVFLVDGFRTLEASVAPVLAWVKDSNTITLRLTNASAGAVNPASIAANTIKFAVLRV